MTEKYTKIETTEQQKNCDLHFDTKHIEFTTTRNLYEMQSCRESKKLKDYIEKEKEFLKTLFSKKDFEKQSGKAFSFSLYIEAQPYISIGDGKKQIIPKSDYNLLDRFEKFIGREFLLFQSMKYDLKRGFVSKEENIEKIIVEIGLDSNNKNFVKDVQVQKK